MSRKDFILGVSSHFHDSAAALVHGEEIIAAAQEERFSRKKGDRAFPEQAINFCLSHLPEGHEPAAIAYYENPALKIDRIVRNAQRTAPTGAALWPRTLKLLREIEQDLPAQLNALCDDPERIFFIPHHRSHAASAYFPAPFDQAAVLVLDGVGEWSTTSMWNGVGSALDPVGEIRFPHSLGLFYSAFTQYCGFKVNSGEYKLMGLAPFGVPRFRKQILDELIDLREDGSFELNLPYFQFDRGLSTISPLFEMLLGHPTRQKEAVLTQHYMDVAASVQAVTEEIVVRLATTTLAKTGQQALCLAGGVALNCVANSKVIARVAGLKDFWVQPASGDSGGALGAALDLALRGKPERFTQSKKPSRTDKMSNSYLGPSYTQREIKDELVASDLEFEEMKSREKICRKSAESLAAGQIICHFDGRMEFGPRALGNRSILADPRPNNVLSKVNQRIKFREDWRPFAPMVLESQVAEFFEEPHHSPFMLLVSKLKPAYRHRTLAEARAQGIHDPLDLMNAVSSDFPAVTHLDFSARLQTITPTGASRAGGILQAFFEATQCPMLLNTSFNVRGEPIVCSPRDAIDCFLQTQLDVLVIGSFLVYKTAQNRAVMNRHRRKRFAAD